MERIGKDKALSVDGISDIIFKKKTWQQIGIQELDKIIGKQELTITEKKVQESEIGWKIAKKLQEYYNQKITYNQELMGNHNLLEQLFIPKVKDEVATFDSSRPITKSSCIYKVLDIIINKRL